MKVITLPCLNISLELGDPPETEPQIISRGFSYGKFLTSDLRKACPHCDEVDCKGDCFKTLEYITDSDDKRQEKKQKRIDKRNAYNDRMALIESMILSHAVAGVDVCSPAYVEGIVSVYEEN